MLKEWWKNTKQNLLSKAASKRMKLTMMKSLRPLLGWKLFIYSFN